MAIGIRTIKMLWGRSGNRCAVCKTDVVQDPIESDDNEAIVGDMAHIIARKDTFTRGDYGALSPGERDSYSNLIILCKTHHKQVDDQPAYFTVERLREIKVAHETWVKARLSQDDINQQRDDEIYTSYVQELLDRIDVERWTVHGSWICSASGPRMTEAYYNKLDDLGGWIISRIWPRRYPDL
jgi:hypothetical protein